MIKMDFNCSIWNWTYLVQNRDKLWFFVNKAQRFLFYNIWSVSKLSDNSPVQKDIALWTYFLFMPSTLHLLIIKLCHSNGLRYYDSLNLHELAYLCP
jgi:hypothetical protein